ncbi:MAG: hypothetical protein GMKNLPBB_03218 [Myxococcota bacterium]|nr:hypothetical protein [Myxococcota bacterium]
MVRSRNWFLLALALMIFTGCSSGIGALKKGANKGDKKSIDGLLDIVSDRSADSGLQAEAEQTLTSLKPEAAPVLRQVIWETDSEIRQEKALAYLTRMKLDQEPRFLLAYLYKHRNGGGKDMDNYIAVCKTLRDAATPMKVQRLIDLMAHTPDKNRQLWLIHAMKGWSADQIKPANEFLVRLLDGKKTDFRLEAAAVKTLDKDPAAANAVVLRFGAWVDKVVHEVKFGDGSFMGADEAIKGAAKYLQTSASDKALASIIGKNAGQRLSDELARIPSALRERHPPLKEASAAIEQFRKATGS